LPDEDLPSATLPLAGAPGGARRPRAAPELGV